MITTDQPAAGLELIDRAMRLNPTYPSYYVFAQAMAHYSMGELEKSADVLSKALERDPEAKQLAVIAAATFAHLQRFDEANAALRQALPEASQKELSALPYAYHFPFTWEQRPEIVTDVVNGLHLAALPPDDPIGYLQNRLETGNTSQRRNVAMILGFPELDATATVPLLTLALVDESKVVKNQAIKSLEHIGPAAKSALPTLMEMAGTSLTGRKAKNAIKAIEGSD